MQRPFPLSIPAAVFDFVDCARRREIVAPVCEDVEREILMPVHDHPR
jgi:hypothetical protein